MSLVPVLIGAGLFASLPVSAATLDLELENPKWAKQTVVELGTCVSAPGGKVGYGKTFDIRSVPATTERYSIAGVPELPTCIRLSWHANGVEIVSPEIAVALPRITTPASLSLLAAQTVIRITAVPTPGGVVSSKFRDGNDGTVAIPLTWATIPPYTGLIEGAGSGPQCRDRRQYLTEPGTPDATLSLVGSVANFSLSTDDLCYDDSGVSSGTLVMRATRSADVSDSLPFAVSSVAASSTDTQEPTQITGVVATLNANGEDVDLSFDAPADVRISGEEVSSLATFTVSRGATPLTPTALTGTGLAGPTFTGADVSDLDPNGTSTQTGADWELTGEGVTDSANDQFRFVSTPITGDATCTVKVTGATSFATDGRIGLIAREQTGTLRRYVSARYLPGAIDVRGHYRAVAEGSATSAGLADYTALPIWLQVQRTENDWDVRASSDGNAWATILELNLGLAATLDWGIQAFSANNGVAATADFENLACTTRPRQAFTDTGPTAGTTPSYTAVSTDVEGNVGAASAAVSIAVPSAPEPPVGNSDTPDYADPVNGVTVGMQTETAVASNAALTTEIADMDCGETLVLAAGAYNTARNINATCPAATPFIVKCATPQTCTTTAAWTMGGARNILTGMLFSGAGAKVSCQGTNNKVIANEFTGWTDGNAITDTGAQCEIAYNEIHNPGAYPGGTNGGNAGQRIGVRSSNASRDMWIHHNYFRDFPDKPIPGTYASGQSDAIEICFTGADGDTPSGAYIERNLIEDHLQGGGTGAGTVDWKCGDGVYRYNTMLRSAGRVDTRQATIPIILEGNWHDDSGGMQIRGNSHIVVGNRLRGGANAGAGGGGIMSLMAGNRVCTSAENGTRPVACNARVEGNDTTTLRVGNSNSAGDNTNVTGTIVRDHTGAITCDMQTGTDGACGDAANPNAVYEFVFATPLDAADVGPDALDAASAAYKAARDF